MIRRPPGAGPEEGSCPGCADGDVWIDPNGREHRLCERDARLLGVAQAIGWRRADVQPDS